ncbi:MAG: adenylosuccinate lyase [Elusimicrobia bacterium]|nr:adenylosuccinate lyase [Elusimicrobiota bacterium]
MIDRYYLKEMKDIWDEYNYYLKWKEVEAAVLRVRGKNSLADRIGRIKVTPEEVRKKESVSGHELNAFLSILEEKSGDNAGEVHKGLTSSDVMDTARMLQVKESLAVIRKALKKNVDILREKALKYKNLVMCGRTHGQFAEPVTLGLKFARFMESGKRTLARLDGISGELSVGQITGAVGTYSLVTLQEEKKILGKLGLSPVGITSQVLPRDIFADYLYLMALVCSFAEEVALEIRLLTQDGIKEASEPFTRHQTGSSAMPHKKNPVICERICGLSRLVRSYVEVGISNIPLWNERDISHSSNERIILEESSSLAYYVMKKLEFVIKGAAVHKENIKKNLEAAGMRIFSSGVLKLLLDSRLKREEAYSLAKDIFMKGTDKAGIRKILGEKAGISSREIDRVLDFGYYLKSIDGIFRRLGLS